MKVSIISPNLSSNALGRAYLLAQLISKFSDVEIIGPILSSGIWPPLNARVHDKIEFKPISRIYSLYNFIKRVSSTLEGDVLYASKPLLTSFGTALIIQKQKKLPLILDIDDWELGLVKEYSKINPVLYAFPHRFNGYQSLPDCTFLEKIIPLAAGENIKVTVSNSFLQKKFGGTIIWHTRDETVFNPRRYDVLEAKREFGIPEDKIALMFFGTPRPHKGVEELIRSIHATKELKNNPEVLLVIGGVGKNRYSLEIIRLGKKLLNDKILFIRYIPFQDIPKAVVSSDIYIIPQKKTHASLGQLPAKLFDAMAMARPIISTDISDIPKILDKAGIVIPSDAQTLEKNLSEKILYLIDNLSESRKLGRRARKRFVRQYGFKPMRRKLKEILNCARR